MNIAFEIASDVGGRKENQDSFGTIQSKLGLIVVICDGMGGASGGKIASELAVETFLSQIKHTTEPDPLKALISAIQLANTKIWKLAKQMTDLLGMGTTLVAILINDEKAIVCHVGDSRLYQIRRGKILFKTKDHSKVYELVKRGIITEEQARLSDESNIILRALGNKEHVDIEINDQLSFEKGDRFMLCSDGISGALPESQLLTIINQKIKPGILTNEVIHKINKIKFENGGGHDNLTIGIIDVKFNSKLRPKTKMKTKIILSALVFLLMLSLLFNVLLYFGKINADDKEQIEPQIDTLKNQIEGNKEDLNRIEQSDTLLLETAPLNKVIQVLEQQSDSITSQERYPQ